MISKDKEDIEDYKKASPKEKSEKKTTPKEKRSVKIVETQRRSKENQ